MIHQWDKRFLTVPKKFNVFLLLIILGNGINCYEFHKKIKEGHLMNFVYVLVPPYIFSNV